MTSRCSDKIPDRYDVILRYVTAPVSGDCTPVSGDFTGIKAVAKLISLTCGIEELYSAIRYE